MKVFASFTAAVAVLTLAMPAIAQNPPRSKPVTPAPPTKPVAPVRPAAGVSVLTAKEVNLQIVGHSVALTDGGMTWYYNRNGKYDADDGRNGRSGTFKVNPDGKLCWTESTGVAGCFQYYVKAGKLNIRRADGSNKTELGEAKIGAL